MTTFEKLADSVHAEPGNEDENPCTTVHRFVGRKYHVSVGFKILDDSSGVVPAVVILDPSFLDTLVGRE